MKRFLLSLFALLLLNGSAFATTISSISVSGNVVTVNSTAHGLVVNQGLCITGSSVSADNVCAVVNTVPNANSLTFNLAGVLACAASCGNLGPAKQIMVLETTQPSQAVTSIHYLFWLTTRTGVANTNAASSWQTATTGEVAAIQRGEFIEINRVVTVPSTLSTSELQVLLQREYTAQQGQLANNIQPGTFFGAFFDGTWH